MTAEKKEHVRLVRLFLSVLILTVAGLVIEEGLDAVLNPWTHSVIHSTMLAGSWLGRVPSNPPQFVFLTMYRPRSSGGGFARCRSCPDVEGWFRFCGATGTSDPYRISGNVGAWRRLGIDVPREDIAAPSGSATGYPLGSISPCA
jgi:hypothetical protein